MSIQWLKNNTQLNLDFTMAPLPGTEIIESERRRLYELKARAAQQVRAEWDERHQQRDQNCNSTGSVESEDSSVTSSEPPSDKETRLDDIFTWQNAVAYLVLSL